MSRVLAGALFSVCAQALPYSSHTEAAPPATDWQPSLRAEAWDFRFSPGMPQHPTQADEGWTFSFPRYEGRLPCRDHVAPDCPSVHYLLTKAGGSLAGRSFRMTIEISGSAEFRSKLEPTNICERPASVRLLVERRGDDLTKEFYRWWSNPQAIILATGQHSITVPLTPDQWSSVLGKKGSAAPLEFAEALRGVDKVGMTFGGGCFFGHGVNVSGGEATFTLKDFAIAR
jgi:hypothetical protein